MNASFNMWVAELRHTYAKRVLFSNKKKWAIKLWKDLHEIHIAKWKKKMTFWTHCILFDSKYMANWMRQNYWKNKKDKWLVDVQVRREESTGTLTECFKVLKVFCMMPQWQKHLNITHTMHAVVETPLFAKGHVYIWIIICGAYKTINF